MKIFYLRASFAVVFVFLAELSSCAQEERRLNLKTYPGSLTLRVDSDAVFDCRDEGPLRAQVQWLRGRHVQVSHRGRLIVQHVQVRHAGVYTCRAVGFSKTFPGAEVTVRLQVLVHGASRGCTPLEARCHNGECVPKEFVCDGEFDCSDGTDELHCLPPGALPLPRPRPLPHHRTTDHLSAWTPSVELRGTVTELRAPEAAELRVAPVACDKANEAPCRNGLCISSEYFCDGEIDCVDASDELQCNNMTSKEILAPGLVTPKMRHQENSIDKAFVRRVSEPRWSEWSPWSVCNERCERTRRRECGTPELTACEGEATERQKCPMKDCQVDGAWSPWTDWTSCSESCGRGTRRRYRKCDSPAPNYGGAYCSGSDGQQENCMQAPCTTKGQWGPWGTWSTCSRGKNGTRTRRRVCEVGGTECRGMDRQQSACNPCPRNLKIGMKPVRLTVTRGRLVNLTCHYRRRGEEPLTLELDLPPVTHSNEVIKGGPRHIVIKDSLTATRCGARRRWTLMLAGDHTLVRCVVRDSEGRVLGKAESKVLSVTSNSVLCHGEKNCQKVGIPNKSWTKKLSSSPSKYTKEVIKKETPQKTPRIVSPPRIVQVHPSFQTVRQGESVHIACIALGDPPLVVQWRADGRELSPRAITNGGVLHVRGVRVGDAGRYVCTARNSAGVSYGYTTIVVT